jgi:hypothetical protein
MNKKQRTYLLAFVVVVLVGAVLAYEFSITGAFAQASYMGQYSGNISLQVESLDENGQVIPQQSIVMAFFNPSGTRVTSSRVTVSWTTTDIGQGYDQATFSMQANITLSIQCTSGTTVWTVTKDIPPTGFPDVNSPQLNGTNQWTLRLANDLQLDNEANKHPKTRTDFVLTFTMVWKAKMWDTVDQVWETQTGDTPLTVTVSYYWQQGFNVKPTFG